MKPKLIILRGNSGSGKTAASKLLQERFGSNTMRISHDMVRMEILHTKGGEGVAKSLPLMIQLLQYGRRHSEVTVLEGILPVPEYGPLFDVAVEEYGQEIFAYYYDLSFEETLRRHATKPNRKEFSEADMRRWWQEKNYLSQVKETVLDEGVSLEDAVERIYGEVTG